LEISREQKKTKGGEKREKIGRGRKGGGSYMKVTKRKKKTSARKVRGGGKEG